MGMVCILLQASFMQGKKKNSQCQNFEVHSTISNTIEVRFIK